MNYLVTPKKIALVALCTIVGVGAYFYWKNRSINEQVVLETTVAHKSDLKVYITATGRAQPIDQVDVGTEVSGTVAKIYVDFNEKVTKGQVLLELDKQKAYSKVEQMQASYASAQNEEQYLKSSLERTQKLLNNGGATSVDLETAQYKYNTAASSLIRSRNELLLARMDLANCTIKSPIEGVVLSRNIEVGQTVAASMSTPTLFIIARDLNRMEVKADVDEADIGQVKVGQKVDFTVDAHSNDAFSGIVSEVRLSPSIVSNVVTYTVVIQADNEENKLLPGMTATCNIVVKEALQVLVLPAQALQFEPTENTPGFVSSESNKTKPSAKPQKEKRRVKPQSGQEKQSIWVQDRNGVLQMRRVQTGINDGVNTEIQTGLKEGEIVATGTRVMEAQSSVTSNAESSPFMPKRPSKRSAGGPPPM